MMSVCRWFALVTLGFGVGLGVAVAETDWVSVIAQVTPSVLAVCVSGDEKTHLPRYECTAVCVGDGEHYVTSASRVADAGQVGLMAGEQLIVASPVGTDLYIDVAILTGTASVGSPPVPAVAVETAHVWRAGEQVLVVGHPCIANPQLRAIVARVTALSADSGAPFWLVQDRCVELDAPFHSGYQGAPVFSAEGRLIGLVGGGSPPPALTRVRPISVLWSSMASIIDSGTGIGRVWADFSCTGSGPPGQMRVLVGTVRPGTEAEKAGLKNNDVLVSVDGAPLGQWDSLLRLQQSTRAGRSSQFVVERQGQSLTLTYTWPPLKLRPVVDPDGLPQWTIGEDGMVIPQPMPEGPARP